MIRPRRAGSPPQTAQSSGLSLLLNAALVLALIVATLDSEAMPIGSAVDKGLSMHPKVAAAEAELRAAGTDVAIAKDGYWPMVQASAGPENSLWGDIGWNVSATQMLYDWGRVKARVAEASAKERQLYHNLKVATEEAALDIAEVYLDILLYEARLATADRYIERLGELAAVTRDRAEHGYADRSEAERTRLELARAQEQRSIERGSLLEASNNYKELVGAPALELQWPKAPQVANVTYPPDSTDPALFDAPRYQKAVANVDAAEAARAESKAALKPKLNLEGNLLRRKIGGHMETDSVLSLTVRFDAMQGLSSFRRVDAAMSREQAARWNQIAEGRDLRRELNTHAELNQVVQSRLSLLEDQLKNVRDVAEAYQEQFEVGNRGIDDLLPIQRELFEAERLADELRSQHIRLQYRAASQLGRLGSLLSEQTSSR